MVNTLEFIQDLIIYQISGKEFCADAKKVISILKPEELSYSPPMEGLRATPALIKNHKEYLAVNINQFFDLQNEKFTNETRVVLIETEEARFGFYVDRVIEVISFDDNIESDNISYTDGNNQNYISCIINYENREFILPDYNKIFKQAS